jgi:hypothetical protein
MALFAPSAIDEEDEGGGSMRGLSGFSLVFELVLGFFFNSYFLLF